MKLRGITYLHQPLAQTSYAEIDEGGGGKVGIYYHRKSVTSYLTDNNNAQIPKIKGSYASHRGNHQKPLWLFPLISL